MTKICARENHLWLIQVFEKGFNELPTRKYKLQCYTAENSMIHVIDPKLNLTKSFPSTICTIDEIKEEKQ